MKRDDFDSRMKTILGVDTLTPSTPITNVDSFSRVEIIMLIEELNGKELKDSQLKVYRTYQELLDLIDG